MAAMKLKFFAALAGLAVLAAGCVDTVTGERTMGVPFFTDKVESRYELSADRVFEAAKQVVREDGTLTHEGSFYNSTNSVNSVKTIQGKVNERTVWVAVAQEDAKISNVTIQTRTQAGGTDMDLAHQLDKQILLKLRN
jgi:Protein of unknown function (DUF3568)